jgi:hypothetical protein
LVSADSCKGIPGREEGGEENAKTGDGGEKKKRTAGLVSLPAAVPPKELFLPDEEEEA